MRVKDYPAGTLVNTSRMLFDNEKTGTHSVDLAALKKVFGSGGGYGGSIYDFVDEMTEDGSNLWLRKSVFRGKNLGSIFTAEQKAAIYDGSFKDLFLGDYWETTKGITQRIPILDFDYWLGSGTDKTSEHHIVVADSALNETTYFYNADHPVSGYGNSYIAYTLSPEVILADVYNNVKNIFSEQCLIALKPVYPGEIDEDGIVTNESRANNYYAFLPNQKMLFGEEILRRSNDSYASHTDKDNWQLSLFKVVGFNSKCLEYLKTLYYVFQQTWLRDFIDRNTGLFVNLNSNDPIVTVNKETYFNGSSYAKHRAVCIYPIKGLEIEQSEPTE